MRQVMVSILFLGLAASGTPQQQCIGQVTQNLRVLDKLILETQSNLTRGYAYVTATLTVPEFVNCTPHATGGNPKPRHQSCLVDTARSYSRPAAIDLNAEAAKLASLQTKRASLAQSAAPAIQLCQQTYPE